MPPRVMVVRGTTNLGDLMQSVALSRLVGPSTGFFRNRPAISSPKTGLGVANGFMLGPMEHEDPEDIFFCGVHWLVRNGNENWIGRSPHPIGARDPWTYNNLTRAGCRSELIGCATMTLPKCPGPRTGEISVDVDGPGERLTHKTPRSLTYDEEWDLCRWYLDKYKRASLVHTTRIHVAMPCVAMGTPVRYTGPQGPRTAILKEIGIEHGKESCPDISEWAERYRDFLRQYSGLQLRDGDPVKPEITWTANS